MIRIGELARRGGVTPEVLRAWERRYGLLRPRRSEGGFRLYGEEDVARIARMRELIRQGLGPAEAARAVLSGAAPGAARGASAPADLRAALERALGALDEAAAHEAIDRLLATVTVETFLTSVALPLLRDIGERWAAGHLAVGDEHFATAVLRGRLVGLTRGWDRGAGPRAALACAPQELHDVGLIAFGILLAGSGWRILYLGQDTPLTDLHDVAARSRAEVAIVSAVDPERFSASAAALRRLARAVPLAIGGAGATGDLARRVGARLLPADPAEAARALAPASRAGREHRAAGS